MILQAIVQLTGNAHTSSRYEVLECDGARYLIFGQRPGEKLIGIKLDPAMIHALPETRPMMHDYKGELSAADAVELSAQDCQPVED